MDNTKFVTWITPLMHYSKMKDRLTLKSQRRACEYCSAWVKDQRVECQAYRLGTEHAYFKHVCKSCNYILFDGSMVKPTTRHRRPTEPQQQRKREAQIKRPGKGASKPVQTPQGQFASLTETAEHYNKSPSSMLGIMKKNPKEYYYL